MPAQGSVDREATHIPSSSFTLTNENFALVLHNSFTKKKKADHKSLRKSVNVVPFEMI